MSARPTLAGLQDRLDDKGYELVPPEAPADLTDIAAARAWRQEVRRLRAEHEARFRGDLEAALRNELAHLSPALLLVSSDFPALVARRIGQQAWERGHASGLNEVLIEADDLVDLLKPPIDGPNGSRL